MKILIVYPNLPLMLIPAMTVGIFTSIIKGAGAECDLFETTAYTNDIKSNMGVKAKLGNGRIHEYDTIEPLPMAQAIPDFVAKVEDYKPDLLLFSVVEDTWKDTIDLLESVAHHNIPHIIGGVFPINAPQVCISHPLVEVISRYEGENVLRDVLKTDGVDIDWSRVDGVWYKKEGRVVKNQPQPLADLNSIIPDYSLYDPVRFRRPMGKRIVRSIQLETYRGCPYSCTFCNSPMTRMMNKSFLRRKSLEQVRRELDYYVEHYDPEYWFIIDDSFLARPRAETFKLLSIIEEYGIPWWCNTRLENVDAELLAAMKRAHCDRISFGIECGNEEYRKNVLKRNITNKTYMEKADVLNNSDIPYSLNIILGMPFETKELIFETIELIQNIGGYDGLGISIFIPYHGTDLRSVSVENGFISEDWISHTGLHGGMALKMPEKYIQNSELNYLVDRVKHLCYFKKDHWNTIMESKEMGFFDKIYDEEFYASDADMSGKDKILNRKKSIWACSSDTYTDVYEIS